MNAKEAVRTAKEYVAEIFSDEPANHIGVEEVVFDEQLNAWKVTVGFFRPWDEKLSVAGVLDAAANRQGSNWKRRSFKVVKVDDGTGNVQSLTDRSLPTLN
ncbi:MAG: hypothetical protein OXE80_08610 [Gammaproteobacteria bacterium]|nr:hypothetical protein [Gammaproteobacteria bacterium]